MKESYNKARIGMLDSILDSLSSLSNEDLIKMEDGLKNLRYSRLQKPKSIQIPTSIFEDRCSSFESIVKYLIEVHNLKYKDVSRVLKRDISTIGVIYRNSKLKSRIDYTKIKSYPNISLGVFSGKLTIFESLIIGLRSKSYTTKQIADITKRHYTTVWTVYKRAERKLKKKGS